MTDYSPNWCDYCGKNRAYIPYGEMKLCAGCRESINFKEELNMEDEMLTLEDFYDKLSEVVSNSPIDERLAILQQAERDAHTLLNKISALIGEQALQTYLHVK